MGRCAFCREDVSGGGTMSLCKACREQIGALRAEVPSYIWYMRAVRRALFESDGNSTLRRKNESFTNRNIRAEIFY